MARDLATTLAWVDTGTRLCASAIAGLSEREYGAPSALPGWTRKHVVAHLAANAEAIGNLVHWAGTGEETPMYASPEERAAGIERGSLLGAGELTRWFTESAASLAAAMAALPEDAWRAEVVTAQGRTVPASETPWMRSREVMVHAVDLATGHTFADLPEDFLRALREDVSAKRGNVPAVEGTLADVTAYLAGRSSAGVTSPGGGPPPVLPPWL
ncbi:maleylpyruvate isomerase family mycothiol-dependent enzyme [Sphaerisporangium siamense]|uniref:Maleylpyruvate isomerase n=1 Tax=Sphaerisporangium siamense TaxID=795645 RepID=A0A7W7D3M0_9ACTN|nr:maleylpyruvate isomerase family mycothiol-dependent enzyme [Sphaerisporangium siamense]MBB4699552.1 maleylpyruvate isomerase [Sphaerisporangium siamense]